jgi:hypothetical protein
MERLALSALDGAACRLRVTREELVLALAGEEARRAFARTHRIGDEQIEAAVRSGAERAIDDAERAGAISPQEATLLRRTAAALPAGALVEALQSAPGRGTLGLLEDLLG